MQSNVAQLSSFDKGYAWYEANKKQVTWGAVAVILVGLIGGFFVWQRDAKENHASEALSVVSTPQLGKTGAREDAAGAYLKIANDFPQSSAAARALLLGAGSLFLEGKYAEAKTQFEKFNREHRDSPLLSQGLLGVAATLDAQGKTDEAITAYKVIVDRHANENAAPQARFALARLYEAQNKPEQARTLFEELARTDQYSSLGSEAGIRLEELKIKYPNMAPPIPPSAATLSTPMVLSNAPAPAVEANPPAVPAANPAATNVLPVTPAKP